MRSLVDCPPNPHSIADPPTAPHVCYFCQINYELLCGGNKWVSEPFNAHASHYSALHFFRCNSPADIARELFTPSTDAASLLVSILNYFFDLG